MILLFFFIGFVIAAQIGGRLLDRVGAKRPVLLGCVLGAVGFWLWGGKVTGLDFGSQQWFIALSGAGMGFMLGPSSTDAVNRASRLSYGEATGITQTVRNYAASLGLAVLGTISVTVMRSKVAASLVSQGVPSARRRRGVEPVPVPQREPRIDSAFCPARLRRRHADRALHHGRGHGRGGDRDPARPASRGAGGSGRSPDGA